MIRLNKKIKYSFYFCISASICLTSINTYKKYFKEYEIDMNTINVKNSELEKDKFIMKTQNIKEEETYDPFELINNLNKDEYFLEKLSVILYNPPLTNKLYPKSNLYGHELIRYFDK